MDRFIVFAWDAASENATRQAEAWRSEVLSRPRRWSPVHAAPGWLVLTSSSRGKRPLKMSGGAGIVLGWLFRRGKEDEGPVASLNEGTTSAIIESHGSALIDHFWGGYLVVWRSKDGSLYVLRDPTGAVPCYRTQTAAIDVLCSHVADVEGLRGEAFAIDWDHLRTFLTHNYFVTEHTGLRELKELLPGQRMRVRPGPAPELSWAWSAVRAAHESGPECVPEARAALRTAADACFAGWSRCYDAFVVAASGGLDSSIVTALLSRSGAGRVTGLHYLAGGYESHEIDLARHAARHTGTELVEAPVFAEETRLCELLQLPPAARPSMQALGLNARALIAQTCKDLGADCFASGHGGDALFLQRAIAGYTLPDYLRTHGIGNRFWRTAYEAAMLQERSIWGVLVDAVRMSLTARSWDPIAPLGGNTPAEFRTMKPDSTGSLPRHYIVHPWMDDSTRLAPGKRYQLMNILALYRYHPSLELDAPSDELMPLFSQPILEECLRIPTYTLAKGGTDRALERLAFRDLLPDDIAHRTGKGFVNHHLLRMSQHNNAFIRALLLDGDIVRQPWIDRRQVERMLQPDRILDGRGMEHIYSLLVAEAWLATRRSALS